MSADFETCPVGTLARLRRVDEAAREVVRKTLYSTSRHEFMNALQSLREIYECELEAERQADEADRMRDVAEDR